MAIKVDIMKWHINRTKHIYICLLVSHLYILEAHSYNKVGCPVGKPSHGESRRPGALTKQLSHNEPGDGTRPDFKEGHKGKNSNDAHI